MTEPIGGSTAPPPPLGPPVSTVPPRRARTRPWWGLGDVVLGLPLIVATAVAGLLISLPFLTADERTAMVEGAAGLPSAALALSLLGQQLGQGAWPVLVAKWKGLGPVRDWRLGFKPVDLVLGLGTAIIAFGLAAVAAAIASELVNLTDESAADNTQFLRDAQGTAWFPLLLVAVVVGAPLAEELFFRGLALRAFEKRAGPVAAVIGSTLLFTFPHFIGSGFAGTVVLFASIGAVGAVLGIITIVVGRLWPAIFAHVFFNTIGAAGALGAFDGLNAT